MPPDSITDRRTRDLGEASGAGPFVTLRHLNLPGGLKVWRARTHRKGPADILNQTSRPLGIPTRFSQAGSCSKRGLLTFKTIHPSPQVQGHPSY